LLVNSSFVSGYVILILGGQQTMEGILVFLIAVAMVVVTQAVVLFIRNKTKQVALALLPNVGLLGVGIILSFVGYIVALSESGSIPGIGFMILMLVTLITTGISTFISLLFIVIIKPSQPNQKTGKPSSWIP
jgi:hypothetical protein